MILRSILDEEIASFFSCPFIDNLLFVLHLNDDLIIIIFDDCTFKCCPTQNVYCRTMEPSDTLGIHQIFSMCRNHVFCMEILPIPPLSSDTKAISNVGLFDYDRRDSPHRHLDAIFKFHATI